MRLDLSKQRLMLSAAVAVLCASAAGALADTTISNATSTQVTTTSAGNVTIDSGGSISLKSGGAALVLNSNNTVTSNGVIVNGDNDGAIGILIDTTNQTIVSPGTGLVSSNTISLTGGGIGKTGVLVIGGNTYFGNITLNNLTPLALTGAGSTLTMSGDSSIAFNASTGTHIDGDITFGGSITGISAATPVSGTNAPILAQFAGTVYGNVVFDSTTAGSSVGNGSSGVVVLGAIHACSADATAQAAVGFVCGTGTAGLGALVNNGQIVTVGQVFVDPTSKDPVIEGGSALSVGASIDGGIYIGGPYTGNPITAGAYSGNGANGLATVVINPVLAGTLAQAINIGPVSSALDNIDPGYSVINRGSITATPATAQVSAAAMFIQGADTNIYTCLGNGTLATCGSDGLGGILDTGTISAAATTNATGVVETTAQVSATGLVIGSYANIPRLDLKAESIGSGAATSGNISASVSGTSGGIATALSIGQNSQLPIINVGQGASITATVTTTNLTPSFEVAPVSSPFTLVATAITDGSSSLTTINNAGVISASVTIVTPGLNASVVSSVRAIDLTSSTADNIKINNSGQILGDLLFGAGGNNYVLNVGNIGSSGGGATANPATGVSNSPNNYAVIADSIVSSAAGSPPSTIFNTINFGAGTGHSLHVGAFGYVNSVIKSNPGALAVTVDNNGTLFVANTSATGSLNASTFDIKGGTLGLTLSQNTTATTPVIRASNEATIAPNSIVALQFGSFVSSGTTNNLADYTTPATQHLVLISAPTIQIDTTTLAQNNAILAQNLPFLFQANATPLSVGSAAGNQTLELALTPRSPGKLNPDGTAGLGLSGDALQQFPFVASALATDPSLGSAIASTLTVYNTPGTSSSGINVAASQQEAQKIFSQFGPDTSGGAKQVAILITDQASGPVAARQRLLRAYGNAPGDLTLWGTEFAGNINNKGRVDADGTLTNYKDHGFGFSLGMDSGSPRGGWYGGAFTFYSGDVIQTLPRDSRTHTQWYMLSGYTSWKGKHLFLDTQLSASYGNLNGVRDLAVSGSAREASGKRASLMGAAGANMGAIFGSDRFQIVPHFSLDGLTMREEGYTETGGGPGVNLQVAPYYANSLRTAFGIDLRSSFPVFGINLTPEARIGYRYDLANSPVKLRAGFVSTGGVDTTNNAMTFIGPDPDTGNLLGGLSVSFGTDTWHLGVHYDYLRGNNGSVSQVGTFTLLGRI
jgi:hypothetical protein